MSQRQFIMGSPVATLGFAAGSQQTITITASEPGVLHADTLCVQAGQDGPGPIPSPGIIQNLQVTSILAYNAIEMIRGRNTPSAPGGAFWAYRGINSITLGDWDMQAGDTFAIQVVNESAGANLLTTTLSAQCAFTPRMVRKGIPEPAGPCTFASSPNVVVAAGAANNATITFDENGAFNLSSLQTVVLSEPIAAAGIGEWVDGSAMATIDTLQLPNSNSLILGQNTPVISVESLSAGYRKYSFADMGTIPVSAGDTIVANFNSNNAANAALAVSIGGRFYPQQPLVRGRGC